jgi:uncharacterized hydrophobic protein (TIGR00271 family)
VNDEVNSASGGIMARFWQRWRPRATLDPGDRRRILASLYPQPGERRRWWVEYAIMLTLSVVIAAMGLSLNSDAVVIGVMLVAPLMTPLLGAAAALVMAWPRRLAQSALAVAASAAGAVGISFGLTALLPAADRVLTTAVVSRTSPDLLEMVVALAAGAAGAYATAREDVSAALPGVAVAVALVPPLAATGYTLAIGRQDLAGGAFLLFLANMVAIVLVGSVVLMVCGFVPSARRRMAAGRIRLGLAAAAVAAVAVVAPLTEATLVNAQSAQTTQAVNQAAVSWLASSSDLTLTGVQINGSMVTVDVSGPSSPPSTSTLAKALTTILGPDAAVAVRWYQTTSSSGSGGAGVASLTLAQLRSLVTSWLKDNGGSGLTIVSLSRSGTAVSVTLSGTSAPPPAAKLAQDITKRAGKSVTVSVTWQAPSAAATQAGSSSASSGTGTSSGIGGVAGQARAVVTTWLAKHPGVQLLGVSATGDIATVDLAGTSQSQVTANLWTDLKAKLGTKVTIDVRFAKLTTLKP